MTARSIEMLITWFGSGRLQPVSASWGSPACLPIGILSNRRFGWSLLLALAMLLYASGVVLGGVYPISAEHPDPDGFVLDEVVGRWIALAAAPFSVMGVLAAFLLFRLFDIVEPWPASWIDRRMHGALGGATDDVVAGIYWAFAVLLIGSQLP